MVQGWKKPQPAGTVQLWNYTGRIIGAGISLFRQGIKGWTLGIQAFHLASQPPPDQCVTVREGRLTLVIDEYATKGLWLRRRCQRCQKVLPNKKYVSFLIISLILF